MTNKWKLAYGGLLILGWALIALGIATDFESLAQGTPNVSVIAVLGAGVALAIVGSIGWRRS